MPSPSDSPSRRVATLAGLAKVVPSSSPASAKAADSASPASVASSSALRSAKVNSSIPTSLHSTSSVMQSVGGVKSLSHPVSGKCVMHQPTGTTMNRGSRSANNAASSGGHEAASPNLSQTKANFAAIVSAITRAPFLPTQDTEQTTLLPRTVGSPAPASVAGQAIVAPRATSTPVDPRRQNMPPVNMSSFHSTMSPPHFPSSSAESVENAHSPPVSCRRQRGRLVSSSLSPADPNFPASPSSATESVAFPAALQSPAFGLTASATTASLSAASTSVKQQAHTSFDIVSSHSESTASWASTSTAVSASSNRSIAELHASMQLEHAIALPDVYSKVGSMSTSTQNAGEAVSTRSMSWSASTSHLNTIINREYELRQDLHAESEFGTVRTPDSASKTNNSFQSTSRATNPACRTHLQRTTTVTTPFDADEFRLAMTNTAAAVGRSAAKFVPAVHDDFSAVVQQLFVEKAPRDLAKADRHARTLLIADISDHLYEILVRNRDDVSGCPERQWGR